MRPLIGAELQPAELWFSCKEAVGQVTPVVGSDIRDTLEQSETGDNSDWKQIKDIRGTHSIVLHNVRFKVIQYFDLPSICQIESFNKYKKLRFVQHFVF